MDQQTVGNTGGNKAWYWILGIVIVAIVVYLAVGGAGKVSPVAGQTVKIGFVWPLSGDAAAYGQDAQKVVAYRLDQINQKAGDNGVKFEVVYEDGKCTGNDAVSAFQKLVDVDGVKFILGGGCSSETLGMAPLAETNKVVVLSAGSSNPKIEDLNDYVFSLSYSDKKTGEDLAKEMSVYKKVAVITEQNDYNIGIRDTFLETLKQYPNVTVVANEAFPKGGTDFRGVLEKIRQAGPEAVLLNPNVGVTAENLLRQIAEMKNWTGYKLYGQFSYVADSVRSVAGNFTEGMVIIDAPSVTSPELAAMKEAIKEAKGTTLDNLGGYYTASTIDHIDLITSLITKLGNDPEKVRQEMSTGQFKGFIGDIAFNGNNFVQLGIGGKYVVKDGKVIPAN